VPFQSSGGSDRHPARLADSGKNLLAARFDTLRVMIVKGVTGHGAALACGRQQGLVPVEPH